MLSRLALAAAALVAFDARAFASASPPVQGPGERPPEATAPPPAPGGAPRELARVSFGAVGDVLPHVSVKTSAALKNRRDASGRSQNHQGFDTLFAGVAHELAATDLTFANLETPVSPSGDAGAVEFHFNAPPALLEALKAAGVDLVAATNNHTFDQGAKGLSETLDQLDKAGLAYAGAGRTRAEAARGLRLAANGIRIAVLAASQFFNNPVETAGPGAPHANKADDPQATFEAVKRARAEADFVIVAVHWGAEYKVAPRPSEIALAHQLLDAGADVILGTHPHVLQPLERYRASDGRPCLVAYSLGNFVSNQSRGYVHGKSDESEGNTRDGALLRFSIVKRERGAEGARAQLEDVSFVPLWTDNARVKLGGREVPEIEVVSIPGALEKARAALEALGPKRPGPKASADEADLQRRIALLGRRREIIESRLGREFLAER